MRQPWALHSEACKWGPLAAIIAMGLSACKLWAPLSVHALGCFELMLPGSPLPRHLFSRASTHCWGHGQVVYEWARGTPFKDICELTDVMEGSIVRTVVRLDETCREFRDAARVMGNVALFQQMEAAQAAIKRDVVFANSLYVSS